MEPQVFQKQEPIRPDQKAPNDPPPWERFPQQHRHTFVTILAEVLVKQLGQMKQRETRHDET